MTSLSIAATASVGPRKAVDARVQNALLDRDDDNDNGEAMLQWSGENASTGSCWNVAENLNDFPDGPLSGMARHQDAIKRISSTFDMIIILVVILLFMSTK